MPPEIAKVGPKDTAKAGYVKPPPVPAGPARVRQRRRFPLPWRSKSL
jgi:hypothetical protein